jgi:hypothetical protein
MRRVSLLAAASAAALVLVLPAAAHAFPDWGHECDGVTDCLSVQSPWVHLDRSGSAGWELFCTSASPYNWEATPANGANIGISWQRSSDWVSEPQEAPFYNDTYGPSPPGTADLYATNWDPASPQSWRYAIGCSDQPNNNVPAAFRVGSAPAPLAPVTHDDALPDKGHKTVVRRCPAGQRVHQARHSVGYFTARPPKAIRHAVRVHPSAHGVRFDVKTMGADQGKMRIQTTLVCG